MPDHKDGVKTGSGQPRMRLDDVPVPLITRGVTTQKTGPAAGVLPAPGPTNIQAAAKRGADQARNPRN